jgi:hypothetical protein
MRSIARLRAVVISQGARIGERPLAGPALSGDRERFLGGFLGEVEVAEESIRLARTRSHSSRKSWRLQMSKIL